MEAPAPRDCSAGHSTLVQRIYQGSSPPEKIIVNQPKKDRASREAGNSLFSGPWHKRKELMTARGINSSDQIVAAKDIP